MKYNFKYLLIFILILACVYVNYFVFLSLRTQNIIRYDIDNKKLTLNNDQIQTLSNPIPNISTFTIPLKAYQAYYYLNQQNYIKSLDIINEIDSDKINPYIHFEDYVKSIIYERINKIDSSYYYAKKAFYNWPKNIDHYEQLNNIAVKNRDTLEIINAFSLIDSVYYDRTNYHNIFIKSLAEAKLSYLVKYDSLKTITTNQLKGRWVRVVEYETGEITIFKDNNIEFTENTYIADGNRFKYNLTLDSISLSPILKPEYILTKSQILFSSKFNSLIIATKLNGKFQTRVYKKMK